MQPSKSADDLSKAIELSLKEQPPPRLVVEPKREPGVPVGLRNVGNTCYFNSLLQCYFMIPGLVREVLQFQTALAEQNSSMALLQELQTLFAFMIRSHRKYIDPSQFLATLVDSDGKPIYIGEQRDVGEVNLALLERIEEGLKEHSKASYQFVASLFYGRHLSLLQYNDPQPTEQQQVEGFGQIMLSVELGDLYTAWDDAYFSKIEGYTAGSGAVITAEQEFWIEELPGVLLFQIQRVKYDKGTYKLHSAFHFPKVLYPDRYVREQMQVTRTLREELRALNQKSQDLKQRLAALRKYDDLPLSLSEVLASTLSKLQDIITSNTPTFFPGEINVYIVEATIPRNRSDLH